MDTNEWKKNLKTLIAGFEPGEQIQVTFLEDLAERTGDYTVVEVKTGRGKGGSKNMTLKNADGDTFTTGTPVSHKILNVVTSDGTCHGFENASDVPKLFETDAGAHEALKKQMRALVSTTGARVRIQDNKGEFGGEYVITQGQQLRGRYGQVRLTLLADDGQVSELWSFRHSGIVTSFEVLSVPTQDTMESTERV